MRLWHKDLIQVLPQKQLVAQWREASAIAGSIQKNGTPNHGLVNYVLDYEFDHFISYCYYVREEMSRRGYRTTDSVWNKIVGLKSDYTLVPLKDLFFSHHNDRYIWQCYYNLQEKHDRGMISDNEWDKVNEFMMRFNKDI